MKKLLLVFAHPDDESLAAGGTIAKYAKAGWQINLICATRGERGSNDSKDWGEDLAQIRQKELEAAAAILGISTVTFLDFKDSLLATEHPGEVEEPIYKSLLENIPDIVITFEPTGITNHPDHKKISLSTTFAFQKYAKAFQERFPHADGPKLYYACLPQTLITFLQRMRAIPKESFGKPWVGIEDKRITTVIDISRQKGTKMKAVAAHKSQQGPLKKLFTVKDVPLLSHEHFLLFMVGTLEVYMGKNDRVSDRL